MQLVNAKAKALAIHAKFKSSNNQRAFVKAARQFLDGVEKSQSNPTVPSTDLRGIALEQEVEGLTVKENPVVPMPITPPRAPGVRNLRQDTKEAEDSNRYNTSFYPCVPPPGLASPISPPGNWALPPGLTPWESPPKLSTPQTSTPQQQEVTIPETAKSEEVPPTCEAAKPKSADQPKRLWTRIEEQPGRLLANNFPFGHTVNVRPRQELTAQWMLPLNYLQKHAEHHFVGSEKMTLRDALQHLCVGLFRRGSADNASSIISKEILGENGKDYAYQVRGGAVVGTVPFYSPRTPGNVVLRLCWQNDPLYTLATGPTLAVQVDKGDVEPTLRFILSNFKAKKGSATSLSSILSLTTLLENFCAVSGSRQEICKAAWGCICEARKGKLCRELYRV